MSEKRKCVNCRHNIRKEKPSGNIECMCEITNTHIGYVKCFEGWCRHWAKRKPPTDEELARIKFEDLIPLMVFVEVFGDSLKDEKEQDNEKTASED